LTGSATDEPRRWRLHLDTPWAARIVVHQAALDVLRPRLAVVAMHVHPPGAPPAPVPEADEPDDEDDPPLLEWIHDGEPPDASVLQAHRELEEVWRRTALQRGRRPGTPPHRGERVILDPAVDRDWWIVTQLAPWSHGLTGFDATGRSLLDAARRENRLLLRLTDRELAHVRRRIHVADGDPDVLTTPWGALEGRPTWGPPAMAGWFLVSLPGLVEETLADLLDGYRTPVTTVVDLLLLALAIAGAVFAVHALGALAVTGLRRWRRRRLPRRAAPAARVEPVGKP
jgi:hypothetical protein